MRSISWGCNPRSVCSSLTEKLSGKEQQKENLSAPFQERDFHQGEKVRSETQLQSFVKNNPLWARDRVISNTNAAEPKVT